MTIPEIQALRDKALKTAFIMKQQHGERSIQHADAAKAIALYDDEIARMEVASSSNACRTTYATFAND